MRRQCAVCGDTNQTNVCFKWQRHRDGKIFHICAMCAEAGKFTADSLTEKTTKTYTTVDSEIILKTDSGSLRQRATMGDYYRRQGSPLVARSIRNK